MKNHSYDVAIIGAGVAGLFAAFECGMTNLSCCLTDSLPHVGGQCSALYPTKPIYDVAGHQSITGQQLVNNVLKQAELARPHYFLSQQVTAMIELSDTGCFQLTTSSDNIIIARAIIIAAGNGCFAPNRPPLEDLAKYEEQEQVAYSVVNPNIYKDANIAIAGGGDSAIDWAVELAPIANKIYLIHRRDKFRAAKNMIARARAADNVEFVTPYQLHSLQGDGEGNLAKVSLKTLSGETRELACDFLLPFFGLATDLGVISQWGLAMDSRHIEVDPTTGQTSQARIYAIGDVSTYLHKRKLLSVIFGEATHAVYHLYDAINPDKPLHFEYSTSKISA